MILKGHTLSGESWSLLDYVGANEDQDAVLRIRCRLWTDDGNKTLTTEKHENPGLEDPPPLPTSCLPQESTCGYWQGDKVAERRVTQFRRAHQSDSRRIDRTAVQRSGWQYLENSEQERIPVALTDGHKLSVKSANLEVAPTAQSSSLPTHTYTRRQSSWRTLTFNTSLTSCTTLRLVTGQSPYELEEDGWHADDVYDVVCIWCEVGFFERSQEHGLSQASA